MRAVIAAGLYILASGAGQAAQPQIDTAPDCRTASDSALAATLDMLSQRGRLHQPEAQPCLARLESLAETGNGYWWIENELTQARHSGILGKREMALARARSALDAASAFPGKQAEAHVVLGELLLQDEAFGESEIHLGKGLALLSDDAASLRMRALLALARVQAMRRELTACSETAQQATALADAAFEDMHTFAALALHATATCQRLAGEHGASIESLDHALEIERGHGEQANRLLIAQLMLMRAQSLKIAGDYARAERSYLDTLAYLRENPEPVAYQLSGVLHSLANLERDDGRIEQSLPRYEEAIALIADVYGPDSIRLSHAYNNYGNALGMVDRFDDAVTAYERALTIARARGEDSERSSLMPISNIALIRLWQSRYAEAEPGFRRGLAITEGESAGSENSGLYPHLGLAASLWGQRRHTEAFAHAEQAERIRQLAVATALADMSENSAMLYQESLRPGLDLAIAIAHDSEDARLMARAWNLAMASRGQVTTETAARLAFARSQTSPEIRESFQRWQQAQLHHTEIRLQPASPENAKLLSAAEDALLLAERTIAAAMPGTGPQFRRLPIAINDVLRSLPDMATLVSFTSSGLRSPNEFSHPDSFARPRDVFAFIGSSNGKPIRLHRLVGEAELQAAVRQWRELLGDPRSSETRWRRAGDRLRQQVFDPLTLQKGGPVFLVPYGDLHQVNFSALPATDGGFLIDYDLRPHFLNHERELLDSPGDIEPPRRILAVSDPAYRKTVSNPDETRTNTCVDGVWSPLPGTRREVSSLSGLLTSRTHFTSLDGQRANRSNVLAEMPGQDVIHLATHAIRRSGECTDGAVTRGASLGTGVTATRGTGIGVLMLASDTNGGSRPYLSESDIASLPLQRTRWAVLSACETGLADSRAYEGAFGLRRAFHLAGVRTVIMSLWRIDDDATADWMAALYRARFQENADTPTALVQAQRSVLLGRRSAGLSDHPYYWAAFIAAGDWH